MKVIERKKLQTIFSELISIIKLTETDFDLMIIKIRYAELQIELIKPFSSFFFIGIRLEIHHKINI